MATGGSSGTVSTRQTQRIQRDIQEIQANPLPFIRDLQLSVADNLNQLRGIMIGPENSDYAGGHFRFVIQFPPEYPFKPPDFIFITAICHPNIDSKTGIACHDQLMATWAPNIPLIRLLTDIHGLLASPNYEIPLEGVSSADKSPKKARQWTAEFAAPSNQ